MKSCKAGLDYYKCLDICLNDCGYENEKLIQLISLLSYIVEYFSYIVKTANTKDKVNNHIMIFTTISKFTDMIILKSKKQSFDIKNADCLMVCLEKLCELLVKEMSYKKLYKILNPIEKKIRKGSIDYFTDEVDIQRWTTFYYLLKRYKKY